MKKILFLIDSLGDGGAERALFNLSENIDLNKYEVHIKTIYDRGIYKDKLNKNIQYSSLKLDKIKHLNYIVKFFSSKFLHRLFIKDVYDAEIAFLEGLSTKIISGASCDTKTAAFVRTDLRMHKRSHVCYPTFSAMKKAYERFDKIAFVGKDSLNIFSDYMNINKNLIVVQNIVKDNEIKKKSLEKLNLDIINRPFFVSVGRLHYQKGYDILIKVHAKLLKEGFKHMIIVVGDGKEKESLKTLIKKYNVEKTFILYGFTENPFNIMKEADWFICSSRYEGFSSAIREAIILHKPIISTDVSGACEVIGKDENGILCKCDELSLFNVMKKVIQNDEIKDYYINKSIEMSKNYTFEKTVNLNLAFLNDLIGDEK